MKLLDFLSDFVVMLYMKKEITGVEGGEQESEDCKMCRKIGEGVVAMKKVWEKGEGMAKRKRKERYWVN